MLTNLNLLAAFAWVRTGTGAAPGADRHCTACKRMRCSLTRFLAAQDLGAGCMGVRALRRMCKIVRHGLFAAVAGPVGLAPPKPSARLRCVVLALCCLGVLATQARIDGKARGWAKRLVAIGCHHDTWVHGHQGGRSSCHSLWALHIVQAHRGCAPQG